MLFDGLGIYILHTRLNFQEGSCHLLGMDLLTISVLKCPGTNDMCLFLILWTPVLLYHKQFPDFTSVLFCKVAFLQVQPYMMNIFWVSSGPSEAIMFCKRWWWSTSLFQICVGQLIKKIWGSSSQFRIYLTLNKKWNLKCKLGENFLDICLWVCVAACPHVLT